MTGIAVVGHLTLDNVCDMATASSRFKQPQGAALGATIGVKLASETRVKLIAKVGSDYPSPILDQLGEYEVDLSLIERTPHPSLGFWILREGEGVGQDLPLSATPIADYTPRLADGACAADVLAGAHICPMPLPSQIEWARYLSHYTNLISVDPQPERYCPAGFDFESGFTKLMRLVKILSLSTEDFPEFETLTKNKTEYLMALGPAVITLKCGADGAIVMDSASRETHRFASISAVMVDVVGAGDAFAGAFLGAYVEGHGPRTAGAYASCAASLIIEDNAMMHAITKRDKFIDRVRRNMPSLGGRFA